jgi:hypothetical protein
MGMTTKFNVGNLANPASLPGVKSLPIADVPIREFSNNVTYASARGMEVWLHNDSPFFGNNNPDVLSNFTSWNTNGPDAIGLMYTGNVELDNFKAIGSLTNPTGTGVDLRSGYTRNVTYKNLDVEGFAVGINVPTVGTNVINGGYFNNVVDFLLHPQSSDVSLGRTTIIEGNPQYGTLSPQALGNQKQYPIFFTSALALQTTNLNQLFTPERILVQNASGAFQELYFPQQAANFVPFPAGQSATTVPSQLVGLTNQQLFATYGLALRGTVAPANAVADPNSNGLLGTPTALPAFSYTLKSAVWTNQLTNYHLSYASVDNSAARLTGHLVTESQATPLQPGWNVLTRTINGSLQTFFVYANVTPPVFTVDPTLPLVINPLDLKTGFVVRGSIKDFDLPMQRMYKMTYPNLDKLPLQTAANGSKFIALTFTIKDLACNTTSVTLDITVDPNAPRQNYGSGMMPGGMMPGGMMPGGMMP